MNKNPWGYRHAALNLLTGEIISCARGNQLKRSVALNNRYEPGKWVFAHNGTFRPEQYANAAYLQRR